MTNVAADPITTADSLLLTDDSLQKTTAAPPDVALHMENDTAL
jgi:hypothetical protein